MKVCTRCGNTNKDKASQCFYCKVDLTAEGSFVSVPNQKSKKKLLSLLLLLPMALCFAAAVYFYLPERIFVNMGMPGLYLGRDLEIAMLMVILGVACMIAMIVLLTRSSSRRRDDEADEEEDPTYLMEITTEEELKKRAEEAEGTAQDASEEDAQTEEESFPTEETQPAPAAEPVAERVTTENGTVVSFLSDGMTVKKLYENLESGAPELDPATMRSLLSAMAVSRLLVVRKKKEEDAIPLYEALSGTFGTPMCVTEGNEAWSEPSALYRRSDPETGAVSDSAFIHGARRAKGAPGKVFFLTVEGLCAAQLPAVLADLIPFFKHPSRPHSLRGKGAVMGDVDPSVELGENLWILAVINEDEEAQIPERLRGLYAEIPMRKSLIASEVEPVDGSEAPSMSLFLRMTLNADDEYGISEETWKKLDLLEELLTKEIGLSFDNKLLRKMERYAGMYLAAGGTESEAVDSMLSIGLLPLVVADLKEYAKRVEEVEEPLHHFLDRVFGIDNLPLTADTLRVLGIA